MTQQPDDMALVRDYARSLSDTAFAEIASRHLNLVYSTALRQANDPHLAQEITQAVFIILSKKAGSLREDTILAGWLHRTTCYVADNALRAEVRRRLRETEASMQNILENERFESAWRNMFPLLDEALERLSEKDRDALVLRYFENRSLQEVALAIGLNERAAQKRVYRSLEKVRTFFLKRGIALPAETIAGAVAANSVQAAPATMSVAGVIAAKNSAASSAWPLAKGSLRTMLWAKLKVPAVTCAALGVIGVGTGLTAAKFNFFGKAPQALSSGWELNGTSARTQDGQLRPYSAHGQLMSINNPGKFDAIRLPIQTVNSGRINLSIARDNNGLPGEVIETFSNVLPPKIGETNSLALESTVHPALERGAKYWVCAEAAEPGSLAIWFYNEVLVPKKYVMSSSPGNWRPAEYASDAPQTTVWYPNDIDTSLANLTAIVVQ